MSQRNRKGWCRISFGMLPFLCTAMIPFSSQPAVAAENRAEMATLEQWKTNAKATQVGAKLVDILNASNMTLRVNPVDKHALYMRGYLYGVVGCTNSAIDDLTKAIQLDPGYASAYTERGVCFMDLKDWARARQDLDRAVQLNPRSGDALFARAKLWLENEKPYMAMTDLRNCQLSVMKWSPALPGELPGNYYNAPDYYMGQCYEAIGNHDEALRYYRSAQKQPRLGGSGYIHRYSDQPLDTKVRVSILENRY